MFSLTDIAVPERCVTDSGRRGGHDDMTKGTHSRGLLERLQKVAGVMGEVCLK